MNPENQAPVAAAKSKKGLIIAIVAVIIIVVAVICLTGSDEKATDMTNATSTAPVATSTN